VSDLATWTYSRTRTITYTPTCTRICTTPGISFLSEFRVFRSSAWQESERVYRCAQDTPPQVGVLNPWLG
jgi:hypothetical protein